MATTDFPAEIRALRAKYQSIEQVSDVEGMRKDIEELSEEAGAPDLWDDPAAAQKVYSSLRGKAGKIIAPALPEFGDIIERHAK